jgi:TIGR00048: radical SAM enzyme, Cfr family
MLDQIYRIQADTGERVANVVVMGTGEPMDNYDNLVRFVRILTDENGLGISQRNVTVSTCGIVPKMYDLAEEKLQITLALSLHAPNDEKRQELMPIANKYSMDEVLDACRNYFDKTGRRITFEYSLVAGVNDSEEDARQLAGRIKGINCHVNLIPVNPIKERSYVRSTRQAVENFKIKLEKYGINVTIRREMGSDIDGACGQLRKSYMEKQKARSDMRIYSATDVGQKRKMNQDYVFASEGPVGNLPNLFTVADGMGGHNAGDYASSHAVRILVDEIREDADYNPVKVIRHAIEAANTEIRNRAQEDENLRGMGTTMVVATIVDQYAYVANVGDSRLYVIQDGIRQVTRDHSLVQEMVRMGEISEAEARNHPDKNIITRALGAEKTVDVDFFDLKLEKGCTILMCSDGLSNMVEDEKIQEIISDPEADIDQKGSALLREANQNGGKDNIAVVLVEPFTNEVEAC